MSERMRRSLISSAFAAVVMAVVIYSLQPDSGWSYLWVPCSFLISFLTDYFVWSKMKYGLQGRPSQTGLDQRG